MGVYFMDTRAFSMARVLRYSVGAFALACMLTTLPAAAQETSACDGESCGGDGSVRDVARDDQRDPVIEETVVTEDIILVPPPVFNLPASNAPVTRESSGQIRSSWAVGVFR
jgi:hypothetical protein